MRRTKQENSLSGFIGAHGGLPAAPANTVAPSITGTTTVGQTLTGNSGTWTGREPAAFSYQWLRDDAPISGATETTYTLVAADSGAAMKFRVTGENWSDVASATSAGTAAVT